MGLFRRSARQVGFVPVDAPFASPHLGASAVRSSDVPVGGRTIWENSDSLRKLGFVFENWRCACAGERGQGSRKSESLPRFGFVPQKRMGWVRFRRALPPPQGRGSGLPTRPAREPGVSPAPPAGAQPHRAAFRERPVTGSRPLASAPPALAPARGAKNFFGSILIFGIVRTQYRPPYPQRPSIAPDDVPRRKTQQAFRQENPTRTSHRLTARDRPGWPPKRTPPP